MGYVCLADSVQDDVPGAADKHKLKCADLGEKKIVLRLDGKYADIKDALVACLSWFREGLYKIPLCLYFYKFALYTSPM